MYHIQSVKILDNLTIDWLLLNCIAAGAMWHCVSKRSEVTALLSLVLALVSFSLSEVSIGTAIATGVLVNALCTLSVKLGWSRLYFWGVLGSCAAFQFTVAVKISALPLDVNAKVWLTLLYLGVFWLPYLVTSLFISEKQSPWRQKLLVCAALLNAVGFVPSMIAAASQLFDAANYVAALAIGTVYAFSARSAKNRGLSGIADTYTFAALSLATLSIPMMIHADWKNLIWLLEVPALVFIGLKHRMPILRYFAFVLLPATVITTFLLVFGQDKIQLMGFAVPQVFFHQLCAAISYGLAAAAYRWSSKKDGIHSEYSGLSFYIYLFAAVVFCWAVPLNSHLTELPSGIQMSSEAASSICAIFWMLESLAILIVALRCKDRLLLKASVVAFKLFAFNTILGPRPYSMAHLVATAVIYCAAVVVRRIGTHLPAETRLTHFRTYITIASVLLWYVTKTYFAPELTLWTLESAATICLGLWLKDHFVQNLGAVGFIVLYSNMLFGLPNLTVMETLAVVGVTYGVSTLYRNLSRSEHSPIKINYARCYEASAAAALTCILHQFVPANCLAFAWSIEGLVLLIMGFLLPDRLSRLYGLGVFALVGCKLLFVDLAQADTPQRILSFVVAGAVLLIASYAYSMFERKFGEVESDEHAELAVT